MVMGQEKKREKKSTQQDAPDQRMKASKTHEKSKNGQKASGKPRKIERGREVVRKVCAQLTNARIFPTFDPSLLENVAQYESNFGKDTTDAKGNAPVGGIWRMTQTGFEDTRNMYAHPELEEYFIRIFKAFRINWSKVEWKRDMDIPLYSGLAAGLLIVICTPGLFPHGPEGKIVVEKEDILRGLYYSSAKKDYDGVREVKARKTRAIAPGMMYQETKKKTSKKTTSQLDLPVAACGKTEKAANSNKLAEKPVPRTLQRSGRTNPVPGKPAKVADDFFTNDYRNVVGFHRGQRDRERRWNTGLGRQGMHTRAMNGGQGGRWARGGTHDRPLRGTQQRQPHSSGTLGRSVGPAFGGGRGMRQEAASAGRQQGVLGQRPRAQRAATQVQPQRRGGPVNDRQRGMRKGNPEEETYAAANLPVRESREFTEEKHQGHGDTTDHEHFTSDKEGGDLDHDGSGSDSDVTYSISDSDHGLSADDASHDNEANVRSGESGEEDVSKDKSDDSADKTDSEEDGSGSSGRQEHSDVIYDSVESDGSSDGSEDDENDSAELSDEDGDCSDGSEDDENDSAELSDEDEGDGSHSDDSFDDSDEDDEDDPDHVYDDPSSDDDSECAEECYDALQQESEEHIYEDPADLLDSDHIYEDPADLVDLEPIYENPDDLLHD